MRKITLRIAGLILTLAALASSAPLVQAQEPLCPFCAIGYKCCIQGTQAKCIPNSASCN